MTSILWVLSECGYLTLADFFISAMAEASVEVTAPAKNDPFIEDPLLYSTALDLDVLKAQIASRLLSLYVFLMNEKNGYVWQRYDGVDQDVGPDNSADNAS